MTARASSGEEGEGSGRLSATMLQTISFRMENVISRPSARYGELCLDAA